MSPARPRALVFDLDGTLVDSAPDLHASLVRVLALEGRRPLTLPEVKCMVGDGVRSLVERALAATGGVRDAGDVAATLARFRADYQGHLTDLTRPYPGVAEGLATLADDGWRLAVCTNKPERPALEILERFGLRAAFGPVIGGDTTPTRKPDAAPLLAAVERLGVAPADAILVGDGPHDAQAALAAGTGFIGVTWGYQADALRERDARTIFAAHFHELPQIARRMRSDT